ncbi:MAG: LamG domain-containing protein [Candidatus Micrarchaeota archaeon]|nr:LamG domain-containing protein [Candidatus Micrarchaeota archaeon]
MEYLMTYGWAILAIAIVMVSLYSLGIFNLGSFSPSGSSGACQVIRTAAQTSLAGQCSNLVPKFVAKFNAQGSYVNVSAAAGPKGPFTVLVWADLPSGWSGGSYISVVTQGNAGGAGSEFDSYFGSASSDYLAFRTRDSSGITHATTVSGPFPAGWQHYSFVFDGTNLLIYVNGVQKVSTNIGSNTLATATAHIQFQGGANGYNSIMLADVQLYNASLDSTTVKSTYAKGIGGAPVDLQHLVGWWPLNGDANDYSGNNNHGIPTNVIWSSSWQSGYAAPTS